MLITQHFIITFFKPQVLSCMNDIKQNFLKISAQIQRAELAAGRDQGHVQLLAVSKTKPAEHIAHLYQVGQRHFGESYLQEALKKQQQLAAFNITWHFIGPIQSNKTKPIAQHFNWVHSVDRLKIAKRLSDQRPSYLSPLNIFLQINISKEDSKSGIYLADLPSLVKEIDSLPNIKLRGVMAIPEASHHFNDQCAPYREIYQAVQQLNNPNLTRFSLGMSGDLEAAIAEGSTIVRIGTALFGKRLYQ